MVNTNKLRWNRKPSGKEKTHLIDAIRNLENQGFIDVDWLSFEKDKTIRLTLSENYFRKPIE